MVVEKKFLNVQIFWGQLNFISIHETFKQHGFFYKVSELVRKHQFHLSHLKL